MILYANRWYNALLIVFLLLFHCTFHYFSFCSGENAYEKLSEEVRKIIDKHAPLITKFLRENNSPNQIKFISPFMTNKLQK